MQFDLEADDPEDILTIFFSSALAPEFDNYLCLGKRSDWKAILKLYNEVKS